MTARRASDPALRTVRAVACVGVAALGLLGAPGVSAHSYEKGAIKVGHLWSPPDAQAVRVYGPIVNDGDTAIRLIGASTPIAAGVRLVRGKHGSIRPVKEIKVPPGRVYALAAWRAYFRLVDVAERPEAGKPFPLTLRFASGTTMDVTVIVESASGH